MYVDHATPTYNTHIGMILIRQAVDSAGSRAPRTHRSAPPPVIRSWKQSRARELPGSRSRDCSFASWLEPNPSPQPPTAYGRHLHQCEPAEQPLERGSPRSRACSSRAVPARFKRLRPPRSSHKPLATTRRTPPRAAQRVRINGAQNLRLAPPWRRAIPLSVAWWPPAHVRITVTMFLWLACVIK